YARSDALSWTAAQHWNLTGAVLDRVDINKSDGLRVLPRAVKWDFEGTNHGWSLSSSAGWARGYDSSIGQTNGVHTGTKAIYTYNGNYPNRLGGPYWATSPTVDCTACSGDWDLKYWRRLGLESYYYDHAYIDVKNAQGSWSRVWTHNGGSINEQSFSQQTHDITNHVQNNPDLRVRFGLGTTDGSVTYTGWNLDDIEFKPRAGGSIGTGANWTSAAFGPGAVGPQMTTLGPYGIMSIDATVPSGSSMLWSVIDGVTRQPIAGFAGFSGDTVDLGAIDWEAHPSLRLKIKMDQPTGASSPIIHGVHLQGPLRDHLQSRPVTVGLVALRNELGRRQHLWFWQRDQPGVLHPPTDQPHPFRLLSERWGTVAGELRRQQFVADPVEQRIGQPTILRALGPVPLAVQQQQRPAMAARRPRRRRYTTVPAYRCRS
ncbi:MAG: hypothetical protein CXX71_04965, partial [Methanobacteriota archaeon]